MGDFGLFDVVIYNVGVLDGLVLLFVNVVVLYVFIVLVFVVWLIYFFSGMYCGGLVEFLCFDWIGKCWIVLYLDSKLFLIVLMVVVV